MPTTDLPEGAHRFLATIQVERGLSPNTAAAYARDLRQYQETILHRGGDVSPATIHAHIERLRSDGLTARSIARKVASIRSYHRFLVAEGIRSDDPSASIDTPRLPAAVPKALTIDQAQALIEAPDVSTDSGIRDRAILEMLYATGCRVSELTDFDLTDLDLETATVRLTGKGDKQRIVPVGSYALEAVSAWLPVRLELRRPGADPGALFLSARGNRMSRQAIWRVVRRHGEAAGIRADHLSPHVLRHSAATHMVEGGADLRTVQELLGHASLSTTQIYTKVTPHHLREIIVTSHPRGR